MRRSKHVFAAAVCLALASLGVGLATTSGSDEAVDLVGIWEARRHFGPEVRGELTLTREEDSWRAEIGGFETVSAVRKDIIELEFPGQRGRFVDRLEPHGKVVGFWIQPPMTTNGMAVASPVFLTPIGSELWIGDVEPLDDVFTFFLAANRLDNGTIQAFLRNPQRNQGIFINVNRIERQGDRIELVGTFFRNTDEQVLLMGRLYPEEPRISIDIDGWGGSYDFRPIGDDAASSFYARAKDPEPYVYRPPKKLQDGWAVGTLAEVGIAVEPIKRLIETEIDPPADDIQDLYLHAMLIARHGKLVLEEYFHGYHRDLPHDTRSASKSLTATLVGAAIEAGFPISESTPVYASVYGSDAAAEIDPRKQQMTVEDLLTMSSGFDCDDADYSTPGNEDRMQEQSENLDWYDYTLNLPMIRDPGQEAVYCSINPNLIGDVLIETTGESLPDLFQQLIAEPLDIERYYLVLQPTGEPYMGGGIHWLPRDFMKLGQLHLDGGVWNGKRILSRAWVDRATAPLYELRERNYGYLWWVEDLPYKNRTVQVFYAGGNGGQVVMGVPELDLVVTFFGANYNSKTLYRAQKEFVPDFILPAVDAN